MRESRTSGSVEGVISNGHSYSDLTVSRIRPQIVNDIMMNV